MDFDLAFYLIDHRLIAIAIITMIAVVCEIGFRAGSRRRDAPESFRSQMSGIGAAMFGLLGLLLGFTLALAIGRWDARRDILVAESNAIGTLSLRAGLFEQPVGDEVRALLREYTDARIALAVSMGDLDQWNAAREKSEALNAKIWSAVERAATSETSPAKVSALITAVNELIDIQELRLASVENFLPASLILLLMGVALVATYFIAWAFGAVGHGGRVAILLLGLLIGAVLYLIMDINRPQRGAFQIGVTTLERAQDSVSETVTR